MLFHSRTSIPCKLILPQSNFIVSQGTTGLHLWEAGQYLAEYIFGNFMTPQTDSSSGKYTCLELGSGLGLVSLVAALSPLVNQVVATDFDDAVLDTLSNVFRLNQSAIFFDKCTVLSLDWNRPSLPDAIKPDLIFAADVVYDPSLIQPLVSTLLWLFDRSMPSSCSALISITKRNESTFSQFFQCLDSACLSYERITFFPPLFIFCDHSLNFEQLYLFRIQKEACHGS